MKYACMILLVVAAAIASPAQTVGEGVSCVSWPDPTGKPFSCSSGLTCATSGPGNLTGICLDLKNDNMNCGAMYTMCSPGSTCFQGMCALDDPDNDPNEAGMPPLAHNQPFDLKRMRLALP